MQSFIFFITIPPHPSNYNKKRLSFPITFVPRTRLELTRANAHYPLKVACLPIPPPGQYSRYLSQ